MSAGRGPDWAKRSAILTFVAIVVAIVGIVVAFWIGYTGSAGVRRSVHGLVSRAGPLGAAAAAILLLAAVGTAIWTFRERIPKALRLIKRLGKQVWWWVLWRRLERDTRSRIENLSQIGAEVLVATLRLGERRQDRRLFLSIPEAEELVRRRRRPPQAGTGGRAWAKKGCEELRAAGLVERFADARNYEYMVWLEPRVLRSRIGARIVDVVEGMLASRGLWRWR
jgi:hypothetical protein